MRLDAVREAIGAAEAGPFVSVYLDDSHDTEDAGRLRELRWRSARSELDRQGAGSAQLDTVERTVLADGPPVGRGGRAVVCAGDRVLVDETLPEPPPTPVARCSALPYLVPLFRFMERPVQHVAVAADRVEADIRAVDREGNEVARESVTGRDHPVHKAGGAGPAHYRLQHHTEETVRRNAHDVIERVDTLVRRTGARMLVVAGEEHTRSTLRNALPRRCQEIAVEVASGPTSAHPDLADYQAEIDRLLAERRTADRDAVVERFTELHGRDRNVVAGLAGVAAALREGRVDTLLVADTIGEDTTVLVGPDVTQVATTRADLPEVADELRECRADEALPAAALATGADVVVVEPMPLLLDGVGALLRYGAPDAPPEPREEAG